MDDNPRLPQPASLPPTGPGRRWLLARLAGWAGLTGLTGAAGLPMAAWALPPRALSFPRDRGAHPELRTEWWYITGQAADRAGRLFGFQLTFFRSRVDEAQAMRSRFAAKQLLFAHAAVTDVQGGKLWHDQRIAREGFGIAAAGTADMALRLRDWSLRVDDARPGRYLAELPAADFGLQLQFDETQPTLLQGAAGLSRKGPDEREASYYYSQPQLAVGGTLRIKGQAFGVTGKAWLDHEWSEEILHPGAVGWDWLGMNLDDGSALTAFRLRTKDGQAVWAGGSFRSPGGVPRSFGPNDVRFTALRHWTSPLSQTRYPVEWKIDTPAGSFTVRALVDDQELDSRNSTGAIYWEGLSALLDAQGRQVGSGYLELTGYAQALKL